MRGHSIHADPEQLIWIRTRGRIGRGQLGSSRYSVSYCDRYGHSNRYQHSDVYTDEYADVYSDADKHSDKYPY